MVCRGEPKLIICSDFPDKVEYAYKMRSMWHEERSTPSTASLYYLPHKLEQFCKCLDIHPSAVFKKSRKPNDVIYRVAFIQFLPSGFNTSRIGQFLNYDHSSVIHWRDELHKKYLKEYQYRNLLDQLGVSYEWPK